MWVELWVGIFVPYAAKYFRMMVARDGVEPFWGVCYQSNPLESRTALPFRDSKDRLTVQIQYTAECRTGGPAPVTPPASGGRTPQARRNRSSVGTGLSSEPL
jgi:hypothetical protein